jgi:HlyD family secretion protein
LKHNQILGDQRLIARWMEPRRIKSVNNPIRRLWPVLLIGVMLASCTAGPGQNASNGPETRTATVERGTIEVRVSGTGQLEADALASLSFGASGTVKQIPVRVGDQVQEGDLLMALDESSLDPSLASAEAERIQAQQRLDDLLDEANWKADLANAQQTLAQARDALDNAQYIYRVRQQGNRASPETIRAAEAKLVLAKDRYDGAKAAYDRLSGRPSDDPARALALTQLESARQSRDSALRTLNWYKGSPTEIEQAQLEADVAVAEANLAKAQDRVNALQDGPDQDQVAAARANLRAAEARVNQSKLTAPFNGTVMAIDYAIGDTAAPGQPAVVVADLNPLHVETTVDELDIAQVEIGQPVTLTLDALPDVTLDGEVDSIDLTPAQESGSTEYPVKVNLSTVDERARVGMTVALEILVASKDNALLVPNWALRFDSDTGSIYVMVDSANGPERRDIQLGLRNESVSEVVGGLDPGSVVTVAVTQEAPSFPGPFGGGG